MEKASETYQIKIQELFPDLECKNKQETIDLFGSVLDDVFEGFYDSPYIQHVTSKPEKACQTVHLAKIPDGVDNFESWLKAYLEKISCQFTVGLEKALPPNIGLIYFAQLLDSHDFDAYFEKVNMPNKMKSSFKSGLLEMFNDKALKYFIQAMSCSCIGLTNAANSLNYLWVQYALFEDEDIHKVINDAKKLEAVTKKASDAGKKGRDKRYAKRDLIKAEALKRKSQKKYKNDNQAAKVLYQEIFEYAELIGDPFSELTQAKETIYKWFRKDSKIASSS